MYLWNKCSKNIDSLDWQAIIFKFYKSILIFFLKSFLSIMYCFISSIVYPSILLNLKKFFYFLTNAPIFYFILLAKLYASRILCWPVNLPESFNIQKILSNYIFSNILKLFLCDLLL